jgi:hypothetical protein
MLQAGKSRVRVWISSFCLISKAPLWPWGLAQPLTEMNNRNFPGGSARPARKTHNLTVICQPIV